LSDKLRVIRRVAARDKDVPSESIYVDLRQELDASRLEYERDEMALKLDEMRHKLAEMKDLHSLRKEYTDCIFTLTVLWLVAVAAAIAFSGFGWGFILPDSVMIAFISSTTVTVVGLFVIVAKWLFPNGSSGYSKSEKSKKKPTQL